MQEYIYVDRLTVFARGHSICSLPIYILPVNITVPRL